MFFPIIGSFLEAVGVILEKRILKIKNIDYRNYTVFSFLGIILASLPFLIFAWKIESGFWNFKNVLIFAFVIFAAILANLLTYYSLKRKNIGEFEPLWLMQPLFTVLLAVLIYSSERTNWKIVLLALIASFSLVAMHWKKGHLNFDRYMWVGLLGSFFFALELVASKEILSYFSGFTFYFIRCSFIFIIALLIYRPSFKPAKSAGWNILLISLIWVLYRAILYYGYGFYGIVYTTILFILAPVLMLVFAVVFLKERMTKRQIITNIVILICVVLAVVIEKI